jgi:hypothetical protein
VLPVILLQETLTHSLADTCDQLHMPAARLEAEPTSAGRELLWVHKGSCPCIELRCVWTYLTHFICSHPVGKIPSHPLPAAYLVRSFFLLCVCVDCLIIPVSQLLGHALSNAVPAISYNNPPPIYLASPWLPYLVTYQLNISSFLRSLNLLIQAGGIAEDL